MKLYNVNLIASATVELSANIHAETEEQAKQIFEEKLQSHYQNMHVVIVEPPVHPHDYDRENQLTAEEIDNVDNALPTYAPKVVLPK